MGSGGGGRPPPKEAVKKEVVAAPTVKELPVDTGISRPLRDVPAAEVPSALLADDKAEREQEDANRKLLG